MTLSTSKDLPPRSYPAAAAPLVEFNTDAIHDFLNQQPAAPDAFRMAGLFTDDPGLIMGIATDYGSVGWDRKK